MPALWDSAHGVHMLLGMNQDLFGLIPHSHTTAFSDGKLTCAHHRVINKDYLRENGALNEHMSLRTVNMGNISEHVINEVALHDADASSNYTAHVAEKPDVSALLSKEETAVAVLDGIAFCGFPDKEEGKDVKGECNLVLTNKRILFLYTGMVERSMRGSEEYRFMPGGCCGSDSTNLSANYEMGRRQVNACTHNQHVYRLLATVVVYDNVARTFA